MSVNSDRYSHVLDVLPGSHGQFPECYVKPFHAMRAVGIASKHTSCSEYRSCLKRNKETHKQLDCLKKKDKKSPGIEGPVPRAKADPFCTWPKKKDTFLWTHSNLVFKGSISTGFLMYLSQFTQVSPLSFISGASKGNWVPTLSDGDGFQFPQPPNHRPKV